MLYVLYPYFSPPQIINKMTLELKNGQKPIGSGAECDEDMWNVPFEVEKYRGGEGSKGSTEKIRGPQFSPVIQSCDCSSPASLFITNSWSLLKLMSTESVMPSSLLILCHPLLLLPSILPSIGVFSNESVLHIRWPKYWSFSNSPSNE